MRTVGKEEALELLAINRRELFGDGEGCVMCALATLQPPRPEFIAESEHGIVVFDRFGTTKGHLLVISKQHLLDTADLPWPLYLELQRLSYDACCALRRAFGPARIFSAVLGASGGLPMSFPHFHIHALPVYETDERARPAHVFSWTAGVLVYEGDEVQRFSDQIRAAWPRPDS